MKKISVVLGLLMASIASAQNANEWVQYETSAAGNRYFVSSARITLTPDKLVEAWNRMEYATPRQTRSGTAAMTYSLALNRVSCERRSMQTIAFYAYSAKGDAVLSDTVQGEWTPIVPDSVGETFLEVVCALAQKKAQ